MPTVPEARRDVLRRDLERLTDLPSAPRVVTEIWRVLADEDASTRALSQVVERDPALSAKILRLANSAYFGLPRPVREVRTACVVLGFSTIESLAVGVTALESLSRTVGAAFDLDGFWRHSVATAIAAEKLARRVGIADPGPAFCGGVIHDVGKLVLASIAPPRYRRVVDGPNEEPIHVREEREYGADHADVGGWLGERWRFPPELCEILRGHHAPDAEGGGRWAALLGLADGIANAAGWPCPGSARVVAPTAGSCPAVLPVTDEALATVAASLPGETDRIDSFLAAARST
jgi:HD-like signal output (HDOD) protein